MTKIKFLLLFALMVGLGACMTPKPKLTLRYRSQRTAASTTNNEAALTVFVTDARDTAPDTNIFDLSERGQAALIKSLEAKTQDAEELISVLALPIAEDPPPRATLDHTVFKRRVVFSVANRSSNEADRLSSTNFILTGLTPAGQAQFESWNRFASMYANVDLGKLSFKQNNDFNFTAGVTASLKPPQIRELAGLTPSVGVDVSQSRSLEEDLILRQRYIEFTGTLRPGEAQLLQQGAVGLDLAGNHTIDLVIRVAPHSQRLTVTTFTDLFAQGQPKTPDQVALRNQSVIVPRDQGQDITAQASLDYKLRRVIKGDTTFREGDDEVEFVSGTTSSQAVLLISRTLLEYPTWSLAEAVGSHEVLHVEKNPGDFQAAQTNPSITLQTLKLTSFQAAFNFLTWLRTANFGRPGVPTPEYRVGERKLILGGRPLTPADVARLQVIIQP